MVLGCVASIFSSSRGTPRLIYVNAVDKGVTDVRRTVEPSGERLKVCEGKELGGVAREGRLVRSDFTG